jgi:Tol biopolymer transport system component
VFDLGLQLESDKPVDTDIYLFDVDARSLEKYLDDPVYFDHFPVFSPDGKYITHVANRFTKSAQIENAIIITHVNKSCQWRLPFGGSFDWSPDSTKIVVSADDGVYIVDLPVFLGESFVNGTDCP